MTHDEIMALSGVELAAGRCRALLMAALGVRG